MSINPGILAQDLPAARAEAALWYALGMDKLERQMRAVAVPGDIGPGMQPFVAAL